MGHLRKARARLLPSPLLGTVLPAVLGLLRQDCCWGPWQIAGPGNGSVEDKNRFSWFYDILCWDRHMSPTHPFFSQLSLRIRTSTGAHLFPAVVVSTCAACMWLYVQRAVTTKPTKHVSCLFHPVSRKHIRLHRKGMQGCVWVCVGV